MIEFYVSRSWVGGFFLECWGDVGRFAEFVGGFQRIVGHFNDFVGELDWNVGDFFGCWTLACFCWTL